MTMAANGHPLLYSNQYNISHSNQGDFAEGREVGSTDRSSNIHTLFENWIVRHTFLSFHISQHSQTQQQRIIVHDNT